MQPLPFWSFKNEVLLFRVSQQFQPSDAGKQEKLKAGVFHKKGNDFGFQKEKPQGQRKRGIKRFLNSFS